MAQLRHDHEQFKSLNTEVVVVVPNGPRVIEWYVRTNDIPYLILSDKRSRVAEQYGIGIRDVVGIKAMKPTVLLVDRTGKILYSHYLSSYVKEPDNNEPLKVLQT